MKNKKKYISFLLAAMLICLSQAVFAAGQVSINEISYTWEGVSLSYSLTTDAPCNVTMLTIIKNGLVENDSDVYAVGEQKNSTGSYRLEFGMPEQAGVTGAYTLYLNATGGNGVFRDFIYVSAVEREALLDEMIAISDPNSIKAYFDDPDNRDTLLVSGIDMNSYQAAALNILYSGGTTVGMSYPQYVSRVNNSLYIAHINSEASSNTWLSKLNLPFEGVLYNDMTPDRKGKLQNLIYAGKPYASEAQLSSKYEELNCLYELGMATSARITDLLAKYSTSLNFSSEAAYRSYLSLSNKSSVNDSIAAALYQNNPYSVSGLMTIIQASLPNTIIPPGGSGGGGGGGSSTSVKAPLSIPNISAPEAAVSEKRASFTDLNEAEWAGESITFLADNKMLSGYDDGTFRPNNSITREEFVTMLVRVLNLSTWGRFCEFSDVPHDSWYYPYVAAAFSEKLVNGIDEKQFGSGMNITRQDMAVMIYRAAKEKMALVAGERAAFSDYDDISDYAREGVNALASVKILNGKDNGNFEPAGLCTRAEAAKVFRMIYDIYNIKEAE